MHRVLCVVWRSGGGWWIRELSHGFLTISPKMTQYLGVWPFLLLTTRSGKNTCQHGGLLRESWAVVQTLFKLLHSPPRSASRYRTGQLRTTMRLPPACPPSQTCVNHHRRCVVGGSVVCRSHSVCYFSLLLVFGSRSYLQLSVA